MESRKKTVYSIDTNYQNQDNSVSITKHFLNYIKKTHTISDLKDNKCELKLHKNRLDNEYKSINQLDTEYKFSQENQEINNENTLISSDCISSEYSKYLDSESSESNNEENTIPQFSTDFNIAHNLPIPLKSLLQKIINEKIKNPILIYKPNENHKTTKYVPENLMKSYELDIILRTMLQATNLEQRLQSASGKWNQKYLRSQIGLHDIPIISENDPGKKKKFGKMGYVSVKKPQRYNISIKRF